MRRPGLVPQGQPEMDFDYQAVSEWFLLTIERPLRKLWVHLSCQSLTPE